MLISILSYLPSVPFVTTLLIGKIYIGPDIAYLGLQHVRAEVHQEQPGGRQGRAREA